MKPTVVILASAVLLSGSAQAQKLVAAQVPAAVTTAFQTAFPAVKTVKWEKEGADYEAGFALGKAEMSAVITAAGVLRETEAEIPVAQLPAPVRKTLATRYSAYKITEAAKIVTVATGAISYEAEVSQGGKQHDVLFNADGREVKK
ncbi:PepSY-like domain-containing protein [Hymenobacter terricola]|uniref:PepSY-like domain-containing protein n=1 Tax=Hymenobacter terricola TaxID=2819236 RepID=UPI001B3054A0|nr:PepSY-like domain-containing protein [Hymenobacter terricola]